MISADAEIEVLPRTLFQEQTCYRLVNSKFPPIAIFEDVASNEEFEDLFAIQALTNPRIQNEVGQLNLVPKDQRPFGIRGCNYALGPFVHVNPEGSRFSNGDYGIFYAAKDLLTAIEETRYHQERYLRAVDGLKFDRIVMRGLKAVFSAELVDILKVEKKHAWYHPDDYRAANALGASVRQRGLDGIVYGSVRNMGTPCYALISPRLISDVIQVAHYESIFDGRKISGVQRVSPI